MKVQYDSPHGGQAEEELKSFLQPVNTSSDQGSMEQLQAEIQVLKASIGEILAVMVESGQISFLKACDMAGMHEWYRGYRMKNLRIVP